MNETVPSGRDAGVPGDTLQALEWERLLEALAQSARSEPGGAHCRALPFETTIEAAATRLAETDEMVRMQAGTDSFPALPVPDLRDIFVRVRKGGAMEAHEFRDLVSLLRMAEDVVRYLARHRAAAPKLAALGEALPPLAVLASLRAEIEWVVDVDGTIKDSASPELRRLTQHVHDLKQTMRRRLETILQSKRYEDVLQEQYFAQREGRYVVPIKTEMRTAIPGIVHDVSASGATVFLEPRELVELNNGIKVGELAVEREVRRILFDLAQQVAAQADVLAEVQRVLILFDVVQAKAALAVRLKAHHVPLNERGLVRLVKARHPLLALSREHVVANDVVLGEMARIMVISGANTGGKTVTLKLVGLFALMARAGLLLPCDPGSEMALFPYIYADIGDAQDLAKDLSSFSSHVTRMIRLLDAIEGVPGPGDRASGRWLVLLDEPMTSTDPAEGAALAQALLQRLSHSAVTGLVTTHYTELKVLAQTAPGFINASVEFDVVRLAPTYRLLTGIPGGSSAIEIAGRLGMQAGLLDAARERLRTDDLALEQLLGDLQAKHRRVAEEIERVEALRREAEQAAQEATRLAERLRDSEAAERRAAKKKLAEEVQRARAAIQAVMDELKRERTIEKAKAAKTKVAAMDVEMAAPPDTTGIPLDTLNVGDHVEVAGLGAHGTLLEAPAGRPRVRVRVGAAEMSVPTHGLVGLAKGQARPSRPGGPPSAVPRRNWRAGPTIEPEMVLDVRGLAADEALDAVVARLDQAVLGGAPWLRIIHGHGTGKLKATLRDYLKGSPYVATFRSGERSEGGDGVTVVELRR